MRLIGILTGLMLSGCYMHQNLPAHRVDCLTFFTDTDMGNGNFVRMLHNVELARNVLGSPLESKDGKHLWPPLVQKDKFCAIFKDVYINIRNDNEWPCALSYTGTCVGMTWYSGEIELNRGTTSLTHELIHLYDSMYRGVSDGSHAGWNESGRWDRDWVYIWDSLPLHD